MPELWKTLHHRDDVFFKLPLARSLIRGHNSRYFETVYIEHLYWWNRFYERYPQKRGKNSFLTAFSDLADSLSERGFVDSEGNAELNIEGQLKNGSHRISLTLAAEQLGKNLGSPGLEYDETGAVDYSLSFFLQQGVNLDVIREATIEKINYWRNPHVSVLLIWPRGQEYRREILAAVSEGRGKAQIVYDVRLSQRGIRNLISLTYSGEDWAKAPGGLSLKQKLDFSDSKEMTVSMVVLEPKSSQEINELKLDLRKLWGNRFQGVHTTDSWSESLRVYTTLSSEKSLATLNQVHESIFSTKLVDFDSIAKMVSSDRLGPLETGLSGSQWLELAGIRRSKDIDMISIQGQEKLISETNHNGYLKRFGFDATKILEEPHLHLWTMGVKTIAPWVYMSIIDQRNEPKDREVKGNLRRFLMVLDNVYEKNRFLTVKVFNREKLATIQSPDHRLSPYQDSNFYHLSRASQSDLLDSQPQSTPKRLVPSVSELIWDLQAFFWELVHKLPNTVLNYSKSLRNHFRNRKRR